MPPKLLHPSETIVIEWLKRTQPFVMTQVHHHDMYEIYYLVNGTRRYFIKERTYTITKGDLVFVNMYDIHRTTVDESPDHERVLLYFHPDYLRDSMHFIKDIHLLSCFEQDSPLIRLEPQEQATVEKIFFQMLQEDKLKSPGYRTQLRLYLMELLILINRHLLRPKRVTPEKQNPLHEKISEITRYINQHYMEEISLETVSKLFFISPYHFCRTFHKVTGFTFNQYLNSVRIREAERLLRETKMQIGQITEQVGYNSSTHMARIFKSMVGLTPLQYRNMKKN